MTAPTPDTEVERSIGDTCTNADGIEGTWQHTPDGWVCVVERPRILPDTGAKRARELMREAEDECGLRHVSIEGRIAAALRAAEAGAIERALFLLRNPTSDMLNSAADDIRREIDPLQNRAKYLLEGAADHIERALVASSPAAASPPAEGDRK